MGIDYNTARMILFAQRSGANLASIATLGRQDIHLELRQTERLLADFDRPISRQDLQEALSEHYCEKLLAAIGAGTIESIDNSAYEGASIVHDMNEPVPASMHGRFDTLIDGGSTEHIFSFPTAMRNCMNMLKVGGHFVTVTCGNNCLGHGFYQFSPEIYFRLFDEANGFRVKAVFLAEISSQGKWKLVPDPKRLGRRVALVNDQPTYIMVLAQKLRDVERFHVPQQSDYVTAWDQSRPYGEVHQTTPAERRRRLPRLIKAALPYPILALLFRLRTNRAMAKEKGFAAYYRAFDPAQDTLPGLATAPGAAPSSLPRRG